MSSCELLFLNSNKVVISKYENSYYSDGYFGVGREKKLYDNQVIDCFEGNDRYIIYEGDESSNFGNAYRISKDNQYTFYFNDHNDYDYFVCDMDDGDIASIYCNKTYSLLIYKIIYNGNGTISNAIEYFSGTYSGQKIVFDSDCDYCFVIIGSNSYTGSYNLSITSYSKSLYATDANYVNIKYSSTGTILSTFLKTFNDFGNLPTIGYKPGYNGSRNNIQFSYDYTGFTTLNYFSQNYVLPSQLNFIGSIDTIFDNNNVGGNNPLYDDRRVFTADSYLSNSTPFVITYCEDDNGYYRGSCFFVDDDYAFSAAHLIYNTTTKSFANIVSLLTSKNYSTTNYTFDIPCIEAYVPYKFIIYNNDFQDYPLLAKANDWSVLKLNTSNLPSYYCHSALGLCYPADCSKTYYNVGYPSYTYSVSGNNSLNDYDGTKYRILAGMSGSISSSDNVLKTYMDLSHGHSGGPCLYKSSDNTGVAVGMVSGSYNHGEYAVFCPVNKYNFAILNKYLAEEI